MYVQETVRLATETTLRAYMLCSSILSILSQSNSRCMLPFWLYSSHSQCVSVYILQDGTHSSNTWTIVLLAQYLCKWLRTRSHEYRTLWLEECKSTFTTLIFLGQQCLLSLYTKVSTLREASIRLISLCQHNAHLYRSRHCLHLRSEMTPSRRR